MAMAEGGKYGPHSRSVERLLEAVKRGDLGQAESLAVAWKAADTRAWWAALARAEEAMRQALRAGAWQALLTRARAIAMEGAPDEAGYATEGVGVAIIARDLISPADFATLIAPWQKVMGPDLVI